ncbi:unnamed protein product [Paramecium pentaurelia]|uniref:Uncharacterized protein n=1 Tax=Paramecium pentaurelia TaxID=43138 RepID=A0A8S1VVA7_9CILI|nr:unnamed protein product [Paramecium pentaurelia]
MKQRDHDRNVLFPISENSQYTYHQYSPPMRPKIMPNQYINKDMKLIQMSAQEKSIQDKRSNIFYEPTKLPKSPPKYIEDRPKSPNLDHRQRMLYQNTSNILSGYSYQKIKQVCESRTKIVEDPNNQLKHQNQNFSDLFDRHCGDNKVNQRVRSVSPQFDWTAHDSIRNAKDCTNNEYTINNNQPKSPLKITEISNIEIKCIQQAKELKTYSKLHGKKTSSKEIVYEGMLKWKNNYK